MRDFIGKKVDVHTPEVMYRGVLVEIGETELHIQSDSGWIVIPVEKVVDIKETEQYG